MAKKILLTFLLLGFILGVPAAKEANAASDFGIKEIASSTQKSIEKDIVPGWQQCLQTVGSLFNQAKNFISEKIRSIDVNKIVSDTKTEFNREVEEFKKSLPETFKGLIAWYKVFSDNWLGKKP